jgi:general secretion pathway protein I
MRASALEPGRCAGFSLIEVLVALAVAGLALAAIADTFGGGLLAQRAGAQAATALTLAEEKIASVGAAQPLRAGTSGGDFAGDFHWQLTVIAYQGQPERDAAAAERADERWRLYRVEATVAWRDGGRRRHLTLATVRLGPPP